MAYFLNIESMIEIGTDGRYRISAKRNLVEEVVKFVDVLIGESKFEKLILDSYRNRFMPRVWLRGKYEIDFVIPYRIGFEAVGIYGELRVEPGVEVWAEVTVEKSSFTEKLGYDEKYEKKLLELAVRHGIGYPVNMLKPEVQGNSLVFYAPDGNVVFEINDKTYKLNYLTFAGQTRKKRTILGWLENVIVSKVSKEFEEYRRSGDAYLIEAENFKISYDAKNKKVMYFEVKIKNLKIKEILNNVKIEDDAKERVEVEVVVGWKDMEAFRSRVGEKIWDILKYYAF